MLTMVYLKRLSVWHTEHRRPVHGGQVVLRGGGVTPQKGPQTPNLTKIIEFIAFL